MNEERESFEGILARMMETAHAAETASERFRSKIAAANKAVMCGCGNSMIKLDVDASMAASVAAGELRKVYFPCVACDGRLKLRWQACGVPSSLSHCALDNFKAATEAEVVALRSCRDFVAAGVGTLIMLGGVGLGKSHLAVAILKAFGRGKFITQGSLLTKLRKTYKDAFAEDIVTVCKDARVLVLDEFGVSSGGRDEFPMIYEILNHRYGERLPVVITSNLEEDEFMESLGDRLVDRLTESAFRICEFTGESKRAARRPKYFKR